MEGLRCGWDPPARDREPRRADIDPLRPRGTHRDRRRDAHPRPQTGRSRRGLRLAGHAPGRSHPCPRPHGREPDGPQDRPDRARDLLRLRGPRVPALDRAGRDEGRATHRPEPTSPGDPARRDDGCLAGAGGRTGPGRGARGRPAFHRQGHRGGATAPPRARCSGAVHTTRTAVRADPRACDPTGDRLRHVREPLRPLRPLRGEQLPSARSQHRGGGTTRRPTVDGA